MSRCAFCNNALLGFGEVTESGKTYHAKCAPSARGSIDLMDFLAFLAQLRTLDMVNEVAQMHHYLVEFLLARHKLSRVF
jgi:hypothetical protein